MRGRGSAASTASSKFQDRRPIRDKSDQEDSHALHRGIQGMGGGSRDPPQR